MSFDFTIQSTTGPARLGRLDTPHGPLETPVFAPVGTQATVKAMRPRDLRELGATLVLANTYHLYCAPATNSSATWAGCTASWPGAAPS